MKDAERKVDSLHRKPSIAGAVGAVDLDIIEHEMLKFLNSPVGEHNPGENRVDEEKQGISDTSSDTGNKHVRIDLSRNWRWLGSYLLPHFPQAEQTMEQVAAPQQLPATPRIYRRHRVSMLALRVGCGSGATRRRRDVRCPCSGPPLAV